jgi:REP element-mobilizing transposase RayT
MKVELIRRRLPHWHPESHALFITWHLYGSLPKCRYPPPGHPSAGQAFAWMDRYLDTTLVGPRWLALPNVADLVSVHIRNGAEERLYELYAWVVMSNHVHLLIRLLVKPAEAFRRVKGRTARAANLALCRTGEPFWQAESYDHWVRNETEMTRIVRYIETNPVTAGVVDRAEDYRWSSAWVRVEQASACNGGF